MTMDNAWKPFPWSCMLRLKPQISFQRLSDTLTDACVRDHAKQVKDCKFHFYVNLPVNLNTKISFPGFHLQNDQEQKLLVISKWGENQLWAKIKKETQELQTETVFQRLSPY